MNKKKPRTNDAIRAEVEELNAALEIRRSLAAKDFAGPVAKSCDAAEPLAKALSTQFRTLRVWIEYRSGHASVFAEPAFDPLDPNYPTHPERGRGELANPNLWPTFAEVVAFERGWSNRRNEISDLRQQVRDLERELARAKEQGPTRFPMLTPWIR